MNWECPWCGDRFAAYASWRAHTRMEIAIDSGDTGVVVTKVREDDAVAAAALARKEKAGVPPLPLFPDEGNVFDDWA